MHWVERIYITQQFSALELFKQYIASYIVEFVKKTRPVQCINFIYNDQDRNSVDLLNRQIQGYPNLVKNVNVTNKTQICNCRTRCMPDRSVDMAFCMIVLQWLSVPVVIQNGIYWMDCQTDELEYIKRQAEKDWVEFLESRSTELKSGGFLITVFPGEGHNTKEFFIAASELFRKLYKENHISKNEFEQTAVNFYPARSTADIARPFEDGIFKELKLLEINCKTVYFDDLGLSCGTVAAYFKTWMYNSIKKGLSTNRSEEEKDNICILYFQLLHEAFIDPKNLYSQQSLNLYEIVIQKV